MPLPHRRRKQLQLHHQGLTSSNTFWHAKLRSKPSRKKVREISLDLSCTAVVARDSNCDGAPLLCIMASDALLQRVALGPDRPGRAPRSSASHRGQIQRAQAARPGQMPGGDRGHYDAGAGCNNRGAPQAIRGHEISTRYDAMPYGFRAKERACSPSWWPPLLKCKIILTQCYVLPLAFPSHSCMCSNVPCRSRSTSICTETRKRR